MHEKDESAALGGEELTLEVNGLKLAARAWGDPTGQPVLALHGWLDNAGSFAALAPLLPGLRLVALDLAGHGRSDWRPPAANYDFVYWLPDVLDAADALGWTRFSLLGHSLGAAIAACATAVAPERVERLALLDGLGPLVSEANETPARLAAALKERKQARRLRPPVYTDTAQMAERLLGAITGLDARAAELLLVRGTRAVTGGSTWSHDPRLRTRSLLRLTEAQVHAFLRALRCPVLLLRAEQGWPVDVEQATARLACVDQLDRRVLPGCHHLHLVDPEPVARALADFFSAARPQQSDVGRGDER